MVEKWLPPPLPLPQPWTFLKLFKDGCHPPFSTALDVFKMVQKWQHLLPQPCSVFETAKKRLPSNIQFIPFVLSIFGKLGGEGDHFQHLASCFRPARPRVRQRPARGSRVHQAATNSAAARSRANAASRKKQVTVAPTPPASSLQLPTCSTTVRASTSTAIRRENGTEGQRKEQDDGAAIHAAQPLKKQLRKHRQQK